MWTTNTDYQSGEISIKSVLTKLEVAEKNIKACEEQIKNEVAALKVSEEENILLQSKLKGAEKQIESMQINITEAQSVTEKLRQENNFYKSSFNLPKRES
ncbi:hypothetical protein CEXT_185351 [Caerostris extrusa]|uniref:Uncharacterized protein n=1 Tax=Caerostris extrusa TaxID=172846 RepID=A0AAV4NL17_CAEEX|nr:hypothetical protein CEXT_185351 [Caerostris extrusa]